MPVCARAELLTPVEIPDSLLLTCITGLVSTGGTWAVMRYRADEAHRAGLAAHRRLDEQEKKLLGLEKDQEFQKERFDEAIERIESSFHELKGSVDKLVQSGLHCSHCDHEGVAS